MYDGAMEDRIVTTTAGPVRGFRDGPVSKFLGVPYAAAPVGSLRFMPPVPPRSWTGVRDATRPGPNAPQVVRDLGSLNPVPLVGAGWSKGDDYLSVNVWTPDEKAQRLPVMVFAHGGAFQVGSKDAPVSDGAKLAARGVVVIAINYRLGIEGFLPIPGVTPNLGLHDHLEALRWVRDNAATFGGDPANVTLFGESAGAMTVANLVASPLTKGLVRRVIVQSGHCGMVREPSVAKRMVDKVARFLKITPTLEGFRSVPVEKTIDVLEASQQPTFKIDLRDATGLEPTYGLSKYTPVHGDAVLPQPPLDLLRQGVGSDIDLLIGTNAEEMNVYFVPVDLPTKLNGVLAWLLLRKSIRNAWTILKTYGMGKGKKGGQALTDALTDLVFRSPARAMALAHQGRTHMYEFDYLSEAFGGRMGACHALELPFVFDTLETCAGPRGIAGDNPPRDLVERVQTVWVDFARDGTFPAPAYTAETRQIYRLGKGEVVTDPPLPAAAFLPR